MIVAYAFIQHTKPRMMYTDDARIASSNVACHHSPWAWEQLVGNQWQDKSWGDPPLGVWDVPFLLLWLHHSLTLRPLLDSLWDWLGFIALGSHSSHSQVLLLGPWEGLQWSPKAICAHLCSSSHRHLLFLYWDLLSIPLKKGAQMCTIWSWTP